MLRLPTIHQALPKPNRLRTHFQMPKLGALDIELPDGAPDASVEADGADVLTAPVARAVLLALIVESRSETYTGSPSCPPMAKSRQTRRRDPIATLPVIGAGRPRHHIHNNTCASRFETAR
jgi:hypothetical protein